MRRSLRGFGLVFVLSVCAQAQSNYAVVNGGVLDPQEHTIPESTGAVRRTSTNSDELYEIPGLQQASATSNVFQRGGSSAILSAKSSPLAETT